MHGGVWIQMRTSGVITDRAKNWIRYSGIAAALAFAGAGIWLIMGINGFHITAQPALDALPNPLAKSVEIVEGAWLSNYRTYPLTMLFPVLGFAAIFATILLSQRNRSGTAFVSSSLAIIGVIMTAGVSMFPFIMPSSTHPAHSLTIWDASSSHLTLTVMFWATVIFLPIVLSYTIWNYRKMWGRLSVDEMKERFAAY
jgi:cytochrome d ubiquinol oxidase subunit II